MGIFDPKADTSVAFEQPVQQPQSMGLALANVGTDIAGSVLRAKAEGGSGGAGADTDAWAIHQFELDIQKANAARAKGNQALANRLESAALLNAQKNGLSYDKNLEGTYSALTGRPGEELLFSEEEIMENRIMETPEYEGEFTATYATHPNATTEERHQLAMAGVARMQGRAALMLDQSIGWTTEKRASFEADIEKFETKTLGYLVKMAEQNGYADLQSIRQARVTWEQTKSGFLAMRPEGVTTEQWKPFEARMSQVDAVFDTLEEISTEEGISALAASELARGIQSKEDWTPGMKLIAKQYFKDGLATGAIAPTEVREMVGNLIYEDFEPSNGQPTGFDEDGNPVEEPLPKSVTDTLSGEDAEASFTRAKNIAKVVGSGDTTKVTTDPTYRNDFFKTTQVAFASMSKIGKENRRFISADGIAQVFNGQIVEGIRKAGTTDPVKARATADMGFNALDNQYAIASTQLSNSLSGTILRLDTQGNIVLNREELLSRTSPEMFNQIEQAANDFYDGNVLALLKDRGMRARMVPIEGGGFRQATAVQLPSEVYEGLGDLETIRGQLRSVKAINNKRQEFRLLRDEFTEETPGSNDNFEGSQGGDTLSSTRLVQLIDKTEGGADYDTLFKFSNREGGAFAGTSVSQMTLGELSDFSQGEYADWSKGQLGYVATPMGRYQIVGSTLRQTMKEMGLPRNMRFTPQVQDAMFHHLAKKALSGKDSPAAKREALRGVWEGFKSVSNQELDRAIAEFEGTEAPSYTDLQNSQNMQAAPSSQTGRPQTRRNQTGSEASASMETPQVDTPDLSGGAGGSIEGFTPQGTPVSSEATTEEASRSAQEDKESSSKINEQQRNRVLRILKAQGVDTDAIAKFDSMEAAQEAINNGTLKDGDLYEVNGEIEVVEKA